jgi:hypothetical protein
MDTSTQATSEALLQGSGGQFVTMSTVGYGDVYPKKPLGKAFASFVIIIGIAIFGFTVATFIEQR